jgi:metallo-beta-lactamase family protein
MHIEFYGAADGVTGSLHRLHVDGRDILLDCGLFQGHRADTFAKNRDLPAWASKAHAVVLSHAHLDHSGNIPTLVKRGFKGNVYCTPATRDLCSVMLRDSAMIQEQDAAYLNKKARQGDRKVEALYSVEDAQRAVGHMISVPYHRPIPVAPGVELSFHNSGHVLGSSLVRLDLMERGKRRRLLFTGDLGRAELPLLQSPEIVEGVEVLMMESTYGNRSHPPLADSDARLAEIIRDTIARGGRVYIPTFALERAQEVLFALERYSERAEIPAVPIYIDSPLAIAITEIYKLHPEVLDAPIRTRILERNDPFSPPGLHYVSDIMASRALQERDEPCIVIAGAGMCEGGRILHHFARGLSKPKNSVVIVGFQADHTLGRRLIEGHRKVKVFGLERDVWCKIYSLNGLSAHADREGLIDFARATAAKGHIHQTLLVHGEHDAREALKGSLEEHGLRNITIAEPSGRVEL